ncbi:MAG: VWA domain-containing protein [Candidatus Omnitrophica bacterium]|nr:VWA domain-containing protein [Candidatus Omnitrophota bacterium]
MRFWIFDFGFWIALSVLVVWLARRMPLGGTRRRVVIGCRLAALTLLCLSLWGLARRTVHEQPSHVLYLVDRSVSMDEEQIEWIGRRIVSLDALRPQAVARAVAAFGADARLLIPFGRDALDSPTLIGHHLNDASVAEERTNLEAALLEALRLMPAEQGGRVILFSDGRQTAGSVDGVLAHLRRLGVSVFPERVPVFGTYPTVWEALSVPPAVARGAPVGMQLVVNSLSPSPQPGLVTVTLAGIPIKRQQMLVRPGWQVLKVSVPAVQQGTMALDVALEIPSAGLRQRQTAYVEVEGPPHLLVVAQRPEVLPLVASALKRREIDVSLARPGDLPTEALPLLDYDAVLLVGVPKSSLSAQQVSAVQTYLASYGGGLVMVGLGGDWVHELATPAPLDALLPVTFEAKGLQEAKRRVCMIMLIDRSASMMGPRIAATKRAAVALIKQLAPEDFIGVFAFDTKPYVVVEVQPAGQVGTHLVDTLVKLRSSGGTDVYPALTIAEDRLDQIDAAVKHILLLSDGNTPFRHDEYRRLTETFRLKGISVSTIGVGAAFINSEYLEWLAMATGGSFYTLRSLDELPQLVARDTQDTLGKLPFAEGYFRPRRSNTTDWFAEIAEWPPLRGFFTATAKPEALVDLTVEADDSENPLLARWSVGQGRVAVFTSDADTRWSPDWIRWPGFDGWWAQVVRWAMRPRLSEELFVWVDESRGTPQLILEGELRDPAAELISSSGTQWIPLSLIPTGSRRWQASLEQVPSGWYQLALADAEAPPLFAGRWIQVGTPPASAELTGQPPDEPMLRQIAQMTAGRYGVPDLAFLPPTTTATTHQPLFSLWLPLVILLLLVDIALRGNSML